MRTSPEAYERAKRLLIRFGSTPEKADEYLSIFIPVDLWSRPEDGEAAEGASPEGEESEVVLYKKPRQTP